MNVRHGLRNSTSLAILLATCFLAMAPGFASADDYLLTDIAQGIGFGYGVGVNDDGIVAIYRPELGQGDGGIYLGSGTSLTRIAPDQGYLSGIGFSGSINHARTVAFYGVIASNPGAERIYTANINGVSALAGSIGVPASSASINDSGEVAYRIPNFNPYDINSTGTRAGFGNFGELYMLQSGVQTLVAGFPPFGAVGVPSINDAGTVAFTSILQNSLVGGVYTGNGGAVTTVADSMGIFKSFDSSSINNLGNVAFSAILDDGSQGIYLSTPGGGQIQRIVGTGDLLFGSTVQATYATNHSLNDAGQIAFSYLLSDGRTGVMRADPDTAGMTSGNPYLPPGAGGGSGSYAFPNPGGRRWYDPIAAYGYEYELIGDGQFLEVMVAPGFFDLQILADGIVVNADLDAGESFFFKAGVSKFSIVGISPAVDGEDPTAFPTFLDFSGSPTALHMTALSAVPEPSTLVLLAMGLLGLGICRQARFAIL